MASIIIGDPTIWIASASMVISLFGFLSNIIRDKKTDARDYEENLKDRLGELEEKVERCDNDRLELRDDNLELRHKVNLLEQLIGQLKSLLMVKYSYKFDDVLDGIFFSRTDMDMDMDGDTNGKD